MRSPVVALLPSDEVLKAYIREIKMRSRQYFVWTFVVILCVCLASYGGYLLIKNRAYEHVEDLTQQYAHKVEPFVEQFAREYDLNIVYLKVFEYNRSRTKVFVVTKHGLQESKSVGGLFFYLRRSEPDSDWELASPPEPVWSSIGSADGRTWPPYGPTDPYVAPEN